MIDGEPTKKCPNCHVRLNVEDKRCFSCKIRVGPPDKHGIAKRPLDWWGYLTAIAGIAGSAYYAWWLFFNK